MSQEKFHSHLCYIWKGLIKLQSVLLNHLYKPSQDLPSKHPMWDLAHART